jgi:hypothetical protein
LVQEELLQLGLLEEMEELLDYKDRVLIWYTQPADLAEVIQAHLMFLVQQDKEALH